MMPAETKSSPQLTAISGYFRALVAERLTDDARIFASFSAGDVVILATWRVRSEPERPAKRGRPVRIVIPVEAVESYVRGSDRERRAAERRFVEWLDAQLAGFDADHDSPPGVEPPEALWKVDRRLWSVSAGSDAPVP